MRKLFMAFLLHCATSAGYAQNSPPQSPTKEALLIANGDYSHFGKLPNPITDARMLGRSLQKIGFQVTIVENATREGMLDALSSFQDRLKETHGIALFHYGGHGVQVGGRNFLIPADADIPDERKVATRAVDLEEVMTTLDASGANVSLVVLDACRDNPLPKTASRSALRGLTVVEIKPKNSMIVYAAEAGSKAEDGLFTPTLANVLTQPGLSLSQVMMKVRREVAQKSNGNQTPGEYNQLFEDVYLAEVEEKLHPLSISSPIQEIKTLSNTSQQLENKLSLNALKSEDATMEIVINEYFRGIAARDANLVVKCLADKVDYYSMGYVSIFLILDDLSGDWERYSNYHSTISKFEKTGPTSCQFILDYTLMQGSKQKRGRLLTSAIVTPERPQKIVSIKARVLSAK
jgi:hypothetical protein